MEKKFEIAIADDLEILAFKYNAVAKFDQFLHFISHDPEIQVVTMKEFYQRYQKNPEQF